MLIRYAAMTGLTIALSAVWAQTFTRVLDAGPPVQGATTSLGCSWGDVNHDGWPDLYITDRPTGKLYINQGDGRFQTGGSGHLVSFPGDQNSAIWGDANNDGYTDLYVSHLGPGTPIQAGQPLNPRVNFMYLNTGPPSFDLVRSEMGELESALNMTWTSEFGDFDNDGDLDLLVPGDQGDQDLFFENRNGSFVQRLDLAFLVPGSFSAAGNFVDMDGDSDQDLLVVNFMRVNNELYRNNLIETGSATFEAVDTAISRDRDEDLSPSWGDYDNDGDLDAFLSVWSNRDNELFRNDGNLSFTEVTDGIVVNDNGWSLGNAWLDFDNDGDLDLFVSDTQGPERLYRNNGDDSFTRLPGSQLGDLSVDPGFTTGVAVADYDNDGDLDIFVPVTNGVNALYRNEGGTNNWTLMTCRGTRSNRSAIGTQVRLETDIFGKPLIQVRQVHGGPTGDRGQSSQRLHFGLGDASAIGLTTISWPSGRTQYAHQLAVNQIIEAVEGQPLPALAAPLTQLVYPWLSRNAQFNSILIVNNPNPSTAELVLTARRSNGDTETTQRQITAQGFLRESVASLFPMLGEGSGLCVVLESESADLRGSWVTNNLAAGSGLSPSQGVAINIAPGSMDEERVGDDILYGFLPVTDGLTSAPVVINTHDRPIDVTLEFSDEQGNLLLTDSTTLAGLEPFLPFAVVANELLPDASVDVSMRAFSQEGQLTGVAFVFNHLSEPAIGNVSSVRVSVGNRRLIYPWLSNNAQFESILIANNLSDEPLMVQLSARRANGDSDTATRNIPARGFLKETASSLFPNLGNGPGFSVELESPSDSIRGRWVTNNLDAPSGRSPAQGVAVVLDGGPNSRLGNQILYGFLPITEGLTSAPVVVNLGEQATDVTLAIYNSNGQLIHLDQDSLRALPPLQPFAAVINQLVEASEDVMVVAQAGDGSLLTGVGFVFNASAEPAIGNVTPVAIDLPTSADSVSQIVAEDGGDNGNASDIRVRFDVPGDETGILEYRIVLVKETSLPHFDRPFAETLPDSRFQAVSPTGSSADLFLSENLLDSDGEAIVVDLPYRVHVLSVADGVDAQISSLAAATESTSIDSQQSPVLLTYISNEGVMISDGKHKVIIDALHRSDSFWVVPPLASLTAVEQAMAPYDQADAVLITHNHGDHYHSQAIRNYLAASPSTKLIAPPQVRQNFSPSDQVLTPSPARGTAEFLEINGMTIEVLHMRHFDMFGNDFSQVENFVYVIHMGGRKIVHFGDVDMVPDNLSPFGLAQAGIDAIIIPAFSTLVSSEQRDTIDLHVRPSHIVAAHLIQDSIASITSGLQSLYDAPTVLTEPFQQVELP